LLENINDRSCYCYIAPLNIIIFGFIAPLKLHWKLKVYI